MGELETAGAAVVEEDAIAFSLVPAGVVQVCFFLLFGLLGVIFAFEGVFREIIPCRIVKRCFDFLSANQTPETTENRSPYQKDDKYQHSPYLMD